jgi:hypothetical protein
MDAEAEGGAAGPAGVQPPLNGPMWLVADDGRGGCNDAAAAAAAEEGERVSVGEAATAVGAFELLDRDLLESATSVRNAPRPPPLHHEEFCSFLSSDGAPLCCRLACLVASATCPEALTSAAYSSTAKSTKPHCFPHLHSKGCQGCDILLFDWLAFSCESLLTSSRSSLTSRPVAAQGAL